MVKKYLPLILLGLGIILMVIVVVVVKGKKTVAEPVDPNDESSLVEVPLEKRPVVSLIPAPDKDGKFGHYLKLKVDKIQIDTTSMDYELLYQTTAGITQGVPGIADLKGKKSFETDLLMGTESSGKFRYDEGVENGSIELKFRKDGKLIAKFKTDFHMQTGVTELKSADGKFTYTLDKAEKNVYYVTMETIGKPDSSFKALTAKDGYAVFTSN